MERLKQKKIVSTFLSVLMLMLYFFTLMTATKEVVKADVDTASYTLAGARYAVYRDSGLYNKIGELTTTANGTSNTISDLPAGTYFVKEIQAPKGFQLDPTVHRATVKNGETTVVLSREEYVTQKLSIKKASADVEAVNNYTNNCYDLTGTEFTVYSDSSLTNVVGKITIKDNKGTSSSLDVKAGRYWVKETKVGKGYLIDPEVKRVDVTIGSDSQVSFNNIPLKDPIALLLQKVDEITGKPTENLQGAEYTFKYYAGDWSIDPATRDYPPTRQWVFRTDSNGEIHPLRNPYDYFVSGDAFYSGEEGLFTLPLGVLTVQESKAPEGYQLDPKVYVAFIKQEGDTPVISSYRTPTVREKRVLGFFEINKSLVSKDDPKFKEPEANAEFVAINKEKVDEYKSFDEALKHFDEISAVMRSKLVTDEKGHAKSTDLVLGTYIVKQTKAPTDSIILKDEFSIEITKDGVSNGIMEFNNEEMRYKIRIVKKDADTGERIVLSGAVFKIKNKATGEYVTQKVDGKVYDKFMTSAKEVSELPEGTFYVATGDKGAVQTPLRVRPGTYVIEEIQAPNGYVRLKQPIELVVSEKSNVKPDENDVFEVVAENIPQSGKLIFAKTGEVLTGWKQETVKKDVQNDGKVEVVEKETPQANVKVQLTRNWIEKEIIKELVETTATTVNESTNTDESSSTSNTDNTSLTEPTFIEKEVDIPHSETIDITSDDKGLVYKKITEKGEYILSQDGKELLRVNDPEEIKFQLPNIKTKEEVKHDGEVISKSFTVNKPVYENKKIAGAKFTLEVVNDIISKDGVTKFYSAGDKVIITQKDTVVGGKPVKKNTVVLASKLTPEQLADKETFDTFFTSTEDGVEVNGIMLGDYKLTEIEAPKGYLKDTKVRTLSFLAGADTIEVITQDAGEINNKKQNLSVAINKVVEGKADYSNIVIGLYAKNVKLLNADSLVDVITPDSNGLVKVSNLPEGEYYFKELATKDGYILNKDSFSVSISNDEKATEEDKISVSKTPIINDKTRKSVTVYKKDSRTKKPIKNVEFWLWKIDGSEAHPVMDKDGKPQVYVTDDEGKIVLENLEYGNYALSETKGATGYVSDYVEVKVAVGNTSSDSLTIENTSTMLSILKVDSETGKPIAGAKLQLCKADGTVVMIDEDNHLVNEGGKPAEWVSTEKPFYVYGVDPNEKYFVKELEAPEAYHIISVNTEVKPTDSKGAETVVIPNKPYKPEGHTEAFTEETEKVTHAIEKAYIHDVLYYKDLVPGRTYKAYAKLTLEDDPEAVIALGETEFVPETSEGSVIVPFGEVDLSQLAGKTTVVFESVVDMKLKKLVIIEAIPDNPNQQVKVRKVEIGTLAKYADGGKEADPLDKEIELIDDTSYKGLIKGAEYELFTTLVRVKDESIVAESSHKFTPESEDGVESSKLVFNAKDYAGEDLVVYEVLKYKGSVIAEHKDKNDKGQTVRVTKPSIKTTAMGKDGTKEILASKQVTLVDKVAYHDLIIGKEYTAKGVLMSKTTGKPVLVDNKEIRGETTFIADKKDGTVDVVFTFDSSVLEGETLVVFEDLIREKQTLYVHADLEDEDQTTPVPKIRTKAIDKDSGTNLIKPVVNSTIVDTVKYNNLIVGNTYTVKGKLMDKSTGKEILINNKLVTAEKSFTATQPNGTIDLEFKFDGSALVGKKIVVFEEVYQNGILVGAHTDINDEDQTVSTSLVLEVAIAKADKDRVNYYLKGAEITIYNKDGKIINDIYGKPAVGITDKDGKVTFKIAYDKTDELYAMETKAPKGYKLNPDKFPVKAKADKVIGTERIDIKVLDQAIIIPPPKTGVDSNNMTLYIILGACGIAGLLTSIAILVIKKKKDEEDIKQ